MDLLSSSGTILALLMLVLGFGFIIFVHELGHFLVAKAVGVKCTQFAIGFGQSLLTWRKGLGFRMGTTEPEYHRRIREHLQAKPNSDVETDEEGNVSEQAANRAAEELGLGETEYRLNWMPLGGYVKMLGQEDLDPNARSADPRAFNNKAIWKRVCVVSAGVVMNGIFAVIFFIAAFLNGVAFPPAVIGHVVPGSPADTTPAENHPELVGLLPGDRVLSIDGDDPSDFTNIRMSAALAQPGESVDMLVARPRLGEQPAQELRFRIMPQPNPAMEGLLFIGVSEPRSLTLANTRNPDSALGRIIRERGLRPGMRLVAVNDRSVEGYWQFDRLLQQTAGQPLTLTFEDEKGREQLTLRPQTSLRQAALDAPGNQTQTVPHLFGLVPAAKISEVQPGSPADGALQKGDVIASLAGTDWPTTPVVQYLVSEAEGEPMQITVLRDGQRKQMTVDPASDGLLGPARLGVALGWATDTPLVARVLDESPFSALNLTRGTRIQRVGETAIDSYTDLRLALQNRAGGEASVTYTLPIAGGVTETQPLAADHPMLAEADALRWTVDLPPFAPLNTAQRAGNVWSATVLGFQKTKLFMIQTYVTLARLFQGTVEVHHLRGPVGIADVGTDVAAKGWQYLMFFLGLISVNLAVINFLPLPIVDGGLFVLLMIEKARGKPAPPAVMSAINLAGLILLGTLALVVTYHDVVRLL